MFCLILFRMRRKALKQSSGGRLSAALGASSVDASLELQEGSELLVEEQGAVSKLIMVEATSLADMEVGVRVGM